MKIWLDDIRNAPPGFDLCVKNAFYLNRMIENGEVDYISFDHDLGDDDGKNLMEILIPGLPKSLMITFAMDGVGSQENLL
jgi:hypothetical protein